MKPLDDPPAREEGAQTTLDLLVRVMARRGLGDLGTAIRELEAAGDTRAEAVTHEGWQVASWLRCRTLLAELYREAGRNADAERVAREVQTLLGVADADHPLLARLSKITQTSRASLNSVNPR